MWHNRKNNSTAYTVHREPHSALLLQTMHVLILSDEFVTKAFLLVVSGAGHCARVVLGHVELDAPDGHGSPALDRRRLVARRVRAVLAAADVEPELGQAGARVGTALVVVAAACSSDVYTCCLWGREPKHTLPAPGQHNIYCCKNLPKQNFCETI